MIIPLLKVVIYLLRKFTKNSGTALPGLILEKYFPNAIKHLLGQFDQVICITGTNGKTTSARMLAHILTQEGMLYVSNSSGSNMLRGILSQIVDQTNIWGKTDARIAVLEVEEATLPKLCTMVKPEIIVVTNIFRDQLDAYGEIDKTYEYIKEAIIRSENPILILNNDDTRVHSLGKYTTNTVRYLSFAEEYKSLVFFENRDNIEKQNSAYKITNIHISDDLSTSFDILYENRKVISRCLIHSPGYHNTYNAAVTLITAQELGVKITENSLSSFQPAFGRGESIQIGATIFQILLGKNPAGVNLNLKLLEHSQDREAILVILNDKTADGKDVSWIWDCDYTLLKNLNYKNIYVAGTRRFDLVLRLKYEGIDIKEDHIFKTIEDSVNYLTKSTKGRIFVLPTYTAMMEFRQELSKKTKIHTIYE